MATLAEKMAASLEILKNLQDKTPCVVLHGTNKIDRTHLTRLLNNGWLQEVMKGLLMKSIRRTLITLFPLKDIRYLRS